MGRSGSEFEAGLDKGLANGMCSDMIYIRRYYISISGLRRCFWVSFWKDDHLRRLKMDSLSRCNEKEHEAYHMESKTVLKVVCLQALHSKKHLKSYEKALRHPVLLAGN